MRGMRNKGCGKGNKRGKYGTGKRGWNLKKDRVNGYQDKVEEWAQI